MSEDSIKADIQNKYEAFYSMGNALFKSKQYERAIWYLTQAIESDKTKVRPLVERSFCYLQLSKYDLALTDIEEARQLDKFKPKILLLHGEIYYQKGEFEKALVIFQKGKKMRSTEHEFQLGINKCELCIKNACGADKPEFIELDSKLDLQEFFDEAYPEIREQRLAKQRQKELAKKKGKKKTDLEKKTSDLPDKMPKIPFNNITMRTLLEAQANDRRFVNNMYNNEEERIVLINSVKSAPEGLRKQKEGFSKAVEKSTIQSGVYLDNRTNFWYRQNPKKVTEVNRLMKESMMSRTTSCKSNNKNKSNLDFTDHNYAANNAHLSGIEETQCESVEKEKRIEEMAGNDDDENLQQHNVNEENEIDFVIDLVKEKEQITDENIVTNYEDYNDEINEESNEVNYDVEDVDTKYEEEKMMETAGDYDENLQQNSVDEKNEEDLMIFFEENEQVDKDESNVVTKSENDNDEINVEPDKVNYDELLKMTEEADADCDNQSNNRDNDEYDMILEDSMSL